MVEEFVQRDIIDLEGYQAFTQTFKDADEFCCLFVVDEEFTNLIRFQKAFEAASKMIKIAQDMDDQILSLI